MNTIPTQSVPMTQPILDDGIDSTIISEPPSPPRSYAPYSAYHTSSYPNSGQTTAVNSIIHQEGVIPDSIATPKVKTKARSLSKLEAAEEKPVDRSRLTRVKVHLMDEIDTHIACIPLAFFCFLTGYTDAISLIAAYVSTAFQTGNTIMGSMALAKLFTKYPHALVNSPTAIPEDALWNPVAAEQWSWHKDHRLLKPDAQALVSFICFMLGALSGRLADRIGPKRRIWLVSSGILGALLTLAAALCSWANHQSSFASGRGSTFVNWTTTLGYCTIGFASAAMGIQAFTGMRIGNAFNSTIVFTLVWIQLLCDPKLFERRAVISRDHRAISLVALMLGALSGRAIVDVIGTHWALGIGAGLRLLVAFSWLAIPRQK